MQFNSIRFRFSILYMVILCSILVLYSSGFFFLVRYILYVNFDYKLEVKAEEMINIIDAYSKSELYKKESLSAIIDKIVFFDKGDLLEDEKNTIQELWILEVKELNLDNDYIRFSNSDGHFIFNSENFDKEKNTAMYKIFFSQQRISSNVSFQTMKSNKDILRFINFSFSFENKNYFVQIGSSISQEVNILQIVLSFIVISIVIILIMTSFVGQFLVKKILTPVMALTEMANNISYKDLDLRIIEKSADREMKYLTDSFNNMLYRLEKSFQHINEFSSQMAHEFKTPLAIMRGEMELVLNQERNVQEYKRVIEVCLGELYQMIRMTEDLLLLAKLDYNLKAFRFETFDIVNFIKEEIIEKSELLSSSKHIKTSFSLPEKPVFINGDTFHLRRLFFNLFDNALKFTPDNGQVDISLKIENNKLYLNFADTGNGINQEELSMIFDTFFRSKKAYTSPGSGLGLSIALSIAKAHHGTIEVKSQLNQGSVFSIILPLQSGLHH